MKFWRSICVIILLCSSQVVWAQDQLLNAAYESLNAKDYTKAIDLFTKIYEVNPNDPKIIQGYTKALIENKDFKTAEKVLKAVLKKDKTNMRYTLQLANVYEANGDSKKANKMYDALIDQNANNETNARDLAAIFESSGLPDNAIEVLEKARKNSGNTLLFAEELAAIYGKKGDFSKALSSLLDLAALQPERIEKVEAQFPRILTDAGKKDTFRMQVIERITNQPDAVVFPELLSWYYIQEKDYESALVQVKALDLRQNNNGKRLLLFAITATKEGEYDVALQAYDMVLEKGKTAPDYLNALTNKISLLKDRMAKNPSFTQSEVADLVATYERYFEDFPQTKNTEARRNYAALLARFADDNDKAIEVLTEMTAMPNVQPILRATAKLDLGDYHLIAGNNWQATLLYSQVDKDFKNDVLGEEARFRNAKLSYFMGDYVWAQGQLDVLKASTSELIANDALNLSVLITENMTGDSNLAPLEMFSRSELLIFRNKTEQAKQVLDSLSSVYTEHPLQDDILMLRASIAQKELNYQAAFDFYKIVFDKYKDDILADDALFQAALINENYLNNKAEAQSLYEKIILDYPGSTLIGEARKAFRKLRGDKADVEG